MPDGVTLGHAREWLRDQAKEKGARCPCCTQFTKIYPRAINSHSARVLIAMWHKGGRESRGWVNLPDLNLGHADEAKTRYWGLIERYPDLLRDDGSDRTGWWRLTADGVAYVNNRLRIPKYAHVFDSRLLGFDGEPVGIEDALGRRFDYRELMDTPVW